MLGFLEAVNICLKQKAFVVRGRAQRSEYWWFFLAQQIFIYAVSLLLMIMSFIYVGLFNLDSTLFNIGIVLSIIIFGLMCLIIIIPSITSAVRRLHDINCRGWWLLLVLLPYIGGIALLIMLALPGTKGDNRFGPDPLANEHDNYNRQGANSNNQYPNSSQDNNQFSNNTQNPNDNLALNKEQTDYTKLGQ